MKVIIEKNTFGDEEEILIKELQSLKIPFEFGIPDSITAGEYFLIRGSCDFVLEFNSKYGDYCNCESFNLSNYDYVNYAPYFGRSMLNDDYTVLTWDLLKKEKEYIFQRYYDYNQCDNPKYFIRPVSGKKIFTGTYLDYKYWDKHIKIIESIPGNSIKPNTKIIISPYKEIEAEYRILMYGNILLDCSIYNGEQKDGDRTSIEFFAGAVAYKPDMFYSLDVCRTDMGWKIVELNNGLCSGWYDCDYNRILRFFKELKNENN